MSIAKISVIAAAMIGLTMPAMAESTEKEEARLAITAAKAKIETNEHAGVGSAAADAQIRARNALEEAQIQLAKHHEGRAIAAAERAGSLADLALATAQARTADARRDAIASDQPQE
jgi:hypothetical protein